VDLLNLEAPDTIDIHIVHPEIGSLYADDERTQSVVITVHSPGSEVALEFDRKQQKAMSQIIAKKGLKGIYKIPFEEQEENNLNRLVALTAGVRNMEFNGNPVIPENIREIYKNPKLGWIRNQVSTKISSWDNYLGE
jgi:hypothetical protein